MRVIILEDMAYRCPEKIYKSIIQKQHELDSKPYYHGKDMEMADFLDIQKPFLREIGVIFYDFRL